MQRPMPAAPELAARETALDWLTALLPPTLISFYYFRFSAFLLELLAIAGYLTASALLSRRAPGRQTLPTALVGGLPAAFCLPATAPLWLAALIGGLTGVFAALPARLPARYYPRLHPVIPAFLLIRLCFGGQLAGATFPRQWIGIDAMTFATPLAAFRGQPIGANAWQLLFGVRAGSIGEGCVAALLLTVGYLLIRRRLRLIAPAAMLLTVVIGSALVWRSPLYGLLAGSTVPAALLLADRDYAPEAPALQAVAGIAAGIITVLVRRYGLWSEGTALGVFAAGVLAFGYPWLKSGVSALIRRLKTKKV